MLRDDPETAGVAEAMPDPPELLPENGRSYDIWNLVENQVRPDGSGGVALDMGVVALVVECLDVADPEAELVKMKSLFGILGKRRKQ